MMSRNNIGLSVAGDSDFSVLDKTIRKSLRAVFKIHRRVITEKMSATLHKWRLIAKLDSIPDT